MYTIAFDAETRIMHIRTAGFWTLATMTRFAVEAVARGTAARLKYGDYAVLADSRDFPVQAPDVAAAIETLNRQSLKITKGPFVCVLGSALAKMQAERVLISDQLRIFRDLDAANDWLAEHWIMRRAA